MQAATWIGRILLAIFLVQFSGFLVFENGFETREIWPAGYGEGHFIGASVAFAIFSALFYFSFFTFSKSLRSSPTILFLPSKLRRLTCYSQNSKNSRKTCKKFILLSFFCLLTLLFIALFYFGASTVLLGEVGRGEFRMGGGGLFRLFVFDYMPKMILVSSSFVMIQSRLYRKKKFLSIWILIIVTSITIGLSTGFRGAVIWFLCPVILMYLSSSQRVTLSKAILFVVSIGFLVFLSVVFLAQSHGVHLASPGMYIFQRVVVAPAEVPWLIFSKYIYIGNFPDYIPTLSYIFGGTILSALLGVDKSDISQFIDYNWSYFITSEVGYPIHTIQGGHNITAMAFGEAIYFLGIFGIFIFALFAGLVCALVGKVLNDGVMSRDIILVSFASVYFWSQIVPWLNSGGISRLLDFSVILSYFFSSLILFLLWNASRISIFNNRNIGN